jgi:transcriptional regulator with XRE-family HTH domain
MDSGKKLKDLRKSKGLTLKELANKTNLSISFISDIEHNRSNPSISTLKIICNILDIPTTYLLEDDEISSNLVHTNLDELLLLLINDFSSWNYDDKIELICYLKAKKHIRETQNENDNI